MALATGAHQPIGLGAPDQGASKGRVFGRWAKCPAEIILTKGTIDKVPELEKLEFEARSAKDSAWYDIAIFLAHRRTNSGEIEVRVRFYGFGAEEDEWVNVRKAIRQRSIPLESSECRSIVEGDLVLCFRERNEEALHFDAHIMEIQRKQHDIRGCRCVFLIKYDHDQSQERVNLRRLSRRPKYF